MKNLKFGIAVALIALGVLVGVAVTAPKQVQAARQAVTQITTSVVDTVLPAPSPSPTPTPTIQPTIAPLQTPTLTPIPVGPQPFPAPSQMPGCGTCPTPVSLGVSSPSPVVIPQTLVFIGADVPANEPQHCSPTPGCPAPFTITWTADFQGGFPGVTPTFKWSDGNTGPTDTVTYKNPGSYTISVIADEIYNGVTYEVASVKAPYSIVVV